MLNRIVLILIAAGILHLQGFAGGFNPSLSLIGSYTYARDFVDVSSGDISISPRHINFGFEFTQDFLLKNDFFLKTGVRYNQYRDSVNGVNPIYTLSWTNTFESLAVPILIGKRFYTSNGKSGSVYLGGTLGVLTTPVFVSSDFNYSQTKYPDHSLGIGHGLESEYSEPFSFFSTIDIGADYHFFKSPRLSLGVLFSFQLNRTASYSCSGTVEETISGEQYSYSIQLAHQFFTGSVLFSYRFGKKSKMPEPKLMLDWGAPK